MASQTEFTGERFIPTLSGEIYLEHVHRYAFAQTLVGGKRVLDAASGEGYGSAMLARSAASVVGLDLSAAAIREAAGRYTAQSNLSFVPASAAAVPFPDAWFDAVVSFETIEHLPQALQAPMLAEFARVLSADGLLILSSPNRALYSDARNYRNEFHLHELYRAELEDALAGHFPFCVWYRQRLQYWSALWREQPAAPAFSALSDEGGAVGPAPLPEAMYFVVVAAKRAAELPGQGDALSLFRDAAGSVDARAETDAREVLRLDALLRERDAALARQTEHILHLESLVAHRERIVEERDGQLASLADANRRLLEQSQETDSEGARLAAENRQLAHDAETLEAELVRRATWSWWKTLTRRLVRETFGIR